MKMFLIDKSGKNYDLVKKIKDHGIENIDAREDYKIKATKNDFVILFEESDAREIPKTANIILITQTKNKKTIWEFVNKYNCFDIIDENLDRNYIAKRICSKIL